MIVTPFLTTCTLKYASFIHFTLHSLRKLTNRTVVVFLFTKFSSLFTGIKGQIINGIYTKKTWYHINHKYTDRRSLVLFVCFCLVCDCYLQTSVL